MGPVLDRPPRPRAGEVTDTVRGAILRRAHEDLGLNAPQVLSLHTDADYIPDTWHLLADVERRYLLAPGTLEQRAADRVAAEQARTGFSYRPAVGETVRSDAGAGFILLALPETEFLTAIEHAVTLGSARGIYGSSGFSGISDASELADAFFRYADGALAAHGAPYRVADDARHFEWVGDPKQYELTVGPALVALGDPRLCGGPRDDFERALRTRRLGAAKDLEDVIIAAAKSVESVLKVLYDEHDVKKPSKHELGALFNGLAHANVRVLPGYVQQLVLAVGEPRNNMAGHGPGATIREVPEWLADASIAAAATAITLLAHHLP